MMEYTLEQLNADKSSATKEYKLKLNELDMKYAIQFAKYEIGAKVYNACGDVYLITGFDLSAYCNPPELEYVCERLRKDGSRRKKLEICSIQHRRVLGEFKGS